MQILKKIKETMSGLFRTDASAVAMIDLDNQQQILGGMFPDDYTKIAKETFLSNGFVYSCIDRIASAVGGLPWEVAKRSDTNSWTAIEHQLSPVIGIAPNPEQTPAEFFHSLIAVLLIGGKVYVERVAPTTGPNAGMPKEFYVHSPDRIYAEIDKQTGAKTKYIYVGVSGKKHEFPIDPRTRQCDIREIKLFNPLNDSVGSPATMALFREIDTLNSATVWNKALIQNSGKSGLTMIVHGNALTQGQVDGLQRHLDATGGALQAGRNKVIPIGSTNGEKATVEIIKDTWSPSELDFNETTWNFGKRICMGIGVPNQMLGIPGESKFANYAESRRVFWEETVLRYAKLVRDSFNRWLFPVGSNIRIQYNIENEPAFAEKRDMMWDRVGNSTVLTLNEKRKLLGFDPVGPEGDVMLAPAGMLPLSVVAGDEGLEEVASEKLKELGLSEDEEAEYLRELSEYL